METHEEVTVYQMSVEEVDEQRHHRTQRHEQDRRRSAAPGQGEGEGEGEGEGGRG